MLRFKNKLSRDFNVLLTKKDPDYDRFKVEHAIPSKFLINKQGIIAWQNISSMKDRPTIEQLTNAIDTNL